MERVHQAFPGVGSPDIAKKLFSYSSGASVSGGLQVIPRRSGGPQESFRCFLGVHQHAQSTQLIFTRKPLDILLKSHILGLTATVS